MNESLNLDEARLAQYFSQGYLPNVDQARDSLEALLQHVADHRDYAGERSTSDLIKESVASRKHPEYLLSLTGGLDSRFILETLRNSESTSTLHCVTWGIPNSTDVVEARRVSGGLPHAVIDTRQVEWDADAIVGYLKRIRPYIGPTMPRLDAVWLFHHVERLSSKRALMINGFLGDMLTGAHLNTTNALTNAPNAFTRLNFTRVHSAFNAQHFYGSFLSENRSLLEKVAADTKFSAFDALDYAFRQEQRIKPVMTVSGNGWYSPFSDPKVIAKWATTPIEKRLGQLAYRQELGLLVREGISIASKPAFVRKLVSKLSRTPTAMRNLANPLRNTSLKALLSETSEAFDKRKLSTLSAAESFNRLLKTPSHRDWTLCMLAMSAELHMRSTN